MDRSSRSIPTGPGSRGGRWHEPDFRHAYQRRWRANHPEYREREALRNARRRAMNRGEDPAAITGTARLTTGRLPVLVAACSCDCGCQAEVQVVCGLCEEELHA